MNDRINSRALIAEFIGTFALVFAIIIAVAMYALQPDAPRGLAYPFIALAHGLVLFILIQTLGAVSGAHFNPAVTLGLLSIRRIAPGTAGAYIVMQALGSLAAAGLTALILTAQAEAVGFAAPAIDASISLGSGMVFEALATFALVWVVVATAVNEKAQAAWAPLAIAGSLMLGVLLIAPLTGAGINPARAFGPALVDSLSGGDWGSLGEWLLAYVVAPVVGGVLAATLCAGLYLRPARPAEAASPPPE
ncbi:MAG: aquaporin [Actinobacteria bacterium]|nr:aquaporin [Actinomycetota bacterium]